MKLRTPDLDTAKPMAPAVTPPAEQFCALSLLKGTTLRRKSKSYKLVPFCVTGAANKAFWSLEVTHERQDKNNNKITKGGG